MSRNNRGVVLTKARLVAQGVCLDDGTSVTDGTVCPCVTCEFERIKRGSAVYQEEREISRKMYPVRLPVLRKPPLIVRAAWLVFGRRPVNRRQ